MGRSNRIGLLSMIACAALTGCAATSHNRDTDKVDAMVEARGMPAPAWPDSTAAVTALDERANKLIVRPLTVERAIELAFLRSPEIRQAYAELGIARADVLEASRLGNPRIGYASLRPEEGGLSRITRSIGVNFADVLLLPARTRLARREYERVHQLIGSALVDLAARVETSWFEYVSAQQVAQVRAAVSRASESAAEFAQRLSDAGNITPRALALELAAASEARILAGRAQAEEIRLRSELAELLGISTRASWSVSPRMPAPLAKEDLSPDLVDAALASRLDVTASRYEVQILESGLGLTRRWRWLGDVEVGYEREREADGARLKGPSISAELPIFNQNGHGVLRAQAALESARARLSALELDVRNEVSSGLDHLTAAREIADAYRTALVPQREAIVARTQEQFDFMLIGAFELLEAKRDEYDAYQEYLESVRDYWVTRAALKRSVGGSLPGDGAAVPSTIGVEEILKPRPHSHEEHSHE